MHLPVTLAANFSGLIVIAVVLFIIGRWVVNQVKESNERARKQAGLENPNQQQMTTGPAPGPGTTVQSPSPMASAGAPVDPAARERARQMYAERAEMLRAQKMGKTPMGQAPAASAQTQAPAPAPAQARMEEPRPLPSQTAGNLPANRTTPTIPRPKPVAQPSAPRPMPVKRPTPVAPAPVAAPTQSYERQHVQEQQQREAASDKVRAQQEHHEHQTQQASPRRDPVTTVANITRTVSAMDLRRAVMMKEILDPPVSLRE